MKCKNDVFLKMISQKPLSKETVVSFNALGQLPDCRTILPKAYVDSSGVGVWNRIERPENRFECQFVGCMTGTQYFEADGYGVYRIFGEDTNEWSDGIITLYVKPENDGDVTVTVSDSVQFTNADSYTVSVKKADVKDDGYIPIVIDLSKTPTTVEGEGWTPSKVGAYIKIGVSVASGISSIAIFESIEDFEINDTIQIMCLSGIDGTDDLETLENECVKGGYDTSSDDPIERTITGKILTPNYWKLNPRASKGDKSVAYQQTTGKFEVIESGDYGIVTLEDKYAEECGFIKAQVADACSAEDSEMELVAVIGDFDIDERQYMVDGNVLKFDKSLVGQEVLVSYPKEVAVTNHHVYSMDSVGSTRYRMSFETESTTGVKTHYQFDDVLITSFPNAITNEETEFEFTIAIQRGANGFNYETWDIVA